MQSSQIANNAADTNYGAIAHEYAAERRRFGVDTYNVHVVLYNDGDIKVELENVVDKHLWTATKKPKETLELTKLGGVEITPKAFENLLCEAIRGVAADVQLELSVGTDNARIMHIKWHIPVPGMDALVKEFTVTLENAGRSDADRVARMMRDVDAQRNTGDVSKLFEQLRVSLGELKDIQKLYDMQMHGNDGRIRCMEKAFCDLAQDVDRALASIQKADRVVSNVRYVTVYNDTEERPYDMTTLTFTVDKKFRESILLITANLCVVGTNCAHLVQTWKYGHENGKYSVAYGQTENYHKEGDKIPRSIPCMAVIQGHDVTGAQPLTLHWRFSNVVPFKTINPKPAPGQAAELHQPTSVVKVEEIMP